jgi:hypothetical protein
MSVLGVNPLLLGGVDGDQVLPIQRSVRLRSGNTASFTRTVSVAGNRRTWTWSAWIKRGTLGTSQTLFDAYSTNENNDTQVYIGAGNNLAFSNVISGSQANGFYAITNAVFRDPSAWYHIVFSVDTTQSTAVNALKVYVNGVQQTFSATTYGGGTNQNTWVNSATTHIIGQTSPPNSGYFDGYLAEVNFIDGQALTPASFGFTNATTGVWQPKQYTGTYGTNGFYLNFQDNSGITATTIGKDSSGNSNNWTPNGISITAGATYDSMIDTPTPYSDGGNNRGNYPTLLVTASQGNGAYSDGNLGFKSGVGSQWRGAHASMFLPSGKFYFEATIQALSANNFFMIGACGIQTTNTLYANYTGKVANGWSVQCNGTSGGTKYNNDATINVSNASFANWVAGDTLQCAVDVDNGRIWFGRNNVWLEGSPSAGTGASYTNLTGAIAPSVSVFSNGTDKFAVNCGQRPFAYTPPTGFLALNSFNLPDSTITNGANHFAATLWTGNGTSQSIVNTANGKDFQPDLVWLKSRSSASFGHFLQDSVRGITNFLKSNTTDAETTTSPVIVSAINSNGFSVLANGNSNSNTVTYVGWQWKASNAAAVTNTSGSITSQVSANTSAGFSIVTFNAGAAGNKTVGHGLGVKPAMFIWKDRSTTGTWQVWHQSLSSQTQSYLILNTTAASVNDSRIWANTAPTSTLLSFESGYTFNVNNNIVAYCFSEVAGYSRFGTYTGNGTTDGPFIYLGFRPRFIMIKHYSGAIGQSWSLHDTTRNTYNPHLVRVQGESTNAENSGTQHNIDVLSNGFKIRTTDNEYNNSSYSYIYAAFAENPFKNSLAR